MVAEVGMAQMAVMEEMGEIVLLVEGAMVEMEVIVSMAEVATAAMVVTALQEEGKVE